MLSGELSGEVRDRLINMAFIEKKQAGICVLAAVLVGGFVLFRYLPLQRRAQVVEHARAAQRLSITESQTRSEQLSLLSDQLLELRREVGDYDAHIPTERASGAFLQKLSEMMNKYSLADQDITPSKESENGELHCISMNLQCKGRLEQVFGFCRELRSMDRLVRVERVGLANDSSFNGEVTLQTDVVVFYRESDVQG